MNNIQVIDIQNTEFTYDSEYIILNDSNYSAIKELDTLNAITWPNIDFEKNFLIGKYTESSGCAINTSYKLTKEADKYLLYIRNTSHGKVIN